MNTDHACLGHGVNFNSSSRLLGSEPRLVRTRTMQPLCDNPEIRILGRNFPCSLDSCIGFPVFAGSRVNFHSLKSWCCPSALGTGTTQGSVNFLEPGTSIGVTYTASRVAPSSARLGLGADWGTDIFMWTRQSHLNRKILVIIAANASSV